MTQGEIRFYRSNEPFYELTNFYGKHMDKTFSLNIDGKEWPSTESYFQAMKFDPGNPEYADLIRTSNSPSKAKMLGEQLQSWGRFSHTWKHSKKNSSKVKNLVLESIQKGIKPRKDWLEKRRIIMKTALSAKFRQNLELSKLLLNTGNAKLIENSPTDIYWGCGKRDKGQNVLGQCLQEVREELREKEKEQE